jgi:uncharacterized protein (DUF433 family)
MTGRNISKETRVSTLTDIGALIVRSPEVHGGRPRIAGTGVTVHRIATWYQMGLSPEEIAQRIGHLALAKAFAALAYYHANRAAIDADLAADEAEAERLKAEHEASAR